MDQSVMTALFDAIIAAILILITRFVIPWIKSQANINQQDAMEAIADVLVRAAEQMYGSGAGEQKLKQVKAWLLERGESIDRAEIEAAVFRMKQEACEIILPPETKADSNA